MKNIFDEIRFTGKDAVKQYNILINGCWQCLSEDKTFDVYNPANGQIIARVPDCSTNDVELAMESAKKYRQLDNYSPTDRLEIMEKARTLLLDNAEEIASVITEEGGKPVSVSRGEVKATAERLKLTLQEVRVLYGEYLPGEWVEDTQNKFAIVMRKPLGVVLTISSFNYPLYIAAAKIIPAILAGNTVVAKPSSDTPLSLIYFVRILEQAGMPQGAINIITGKGKTIGDALVTHDDVAAVSFTGSTAIGQHIAQQVGIKKIHLELGGKASAIVLKDADIDNAVKHIAKGSFRNSGQRCDAVSRVLIDPSVKQQFLDKMLKEMEKYRLGDPADEKTGVGPVINQGAVKRIDALVQDAREKGADVICGGAYKDLFYEPTLLDKVTTEMDIAWEEIFGPVLPVIDIKSPEQAIELSNRSEYGLDSCVFTNSINYAIKIAKELEDGTVTINAAPAHGVGHFPFGGNKRSGIGREGLKYSIDELTKLHTVIFTQN